MTAPDLNIGDLIQAVVTPPLTFGAATDPGQVALAKLLAAEHTHDPAIRRAWVEDAERERDQHIRLWLLEDRAIKDGSVMRRWHLQTTPSAAWWWMRTAAAAEGHRLVLTEVPPACGECGDDKNSAINQDCQTCAVAGDTEKVDAAYASLKTWGNR